MADISEELLKKLNIDGAISAKEFTSMLLFENNDTDINDIRKTFKRNFLDKFKNTLSKITTKDIKSIFDPLNLSGLLQDPNSLRDEFKEYKNKLRKFLKKANAELDKDDTTVDSVNNSNKNNKNKSSISEQRDFIAKDQEVEFGDDTKKFLKELLGRTSEKQAKERKSEMESLGKSMAEYMDSSSASDNGMLNAIGWAAMLGLGAYYWDDYIRPFLEDKFSFMGKLEGVINGIEKALYMTILKIPQLILTSIAKFLEVMDGVIKAAFKVLGIGSKVGAQVGVNAAASVASQAAKPAVQGGLAAMEKISAGVADDVAGKVATEAGTKAATKVAGTSLLQGMSKVLARVANFIPGVGALISFGFAMDRFNKGDTVGGWIDIIGCIGSLLSLSVVAAPIGIPLSWAAIGLNAILDLTTPGDTEQERNNNKGSTMKSWFSKPYEWLKNTPWIKKLINMGSAFGSFAAGKWSEGVSYIKDSWLSPLGDLFEYIGGADEATPAQPKPDIKAIKNKSIDEIDKKFTPIKETKQLSEIDLLKKERDDTIKEMEFVKKQAEEQMKNMSVSSDRQNIRDLPIQENLDKFNKLKENLNQINETLDAVSGDAKNIGESKIKIQDNTASNISENDIKSLASNKNNDMEKLGKVLMSQFENINNQLINGLSKASEASSNSFVNISNSGGGQNKNPFTLDADMVLRSRQLYMNSTRVLA